jgi:hypothetical protein
MHMAAVGVLACSWRFQVFFWVFWMCFEGHMLYEGSVAWMQHMCCHQCALQGVAMLAMHC